jgi:polyferredoxin
MGCQEGLGRPIPRWMRWDGWPFVAFALTTLYGQLVSVYQYPKAALLVLGGSTVAAIAVGLVYTRGKRAWCRHLCPVNGVFSLLSKLAPMHYKVDEQRWLESTRQSGVIRIQAVDCAPCSRCAICRAAVVAICAAAAAVTATPSA